MFKFLKQKGIPRAADTRGRLLCLFFVFVVLIFSVAPTAFAGDGTGGTTGSSTGSSISETEDQFPDQTMPTAVSPADFKHEFNFTVYCWYESVYSGDLMMTGMGGGDSSVSNYIDLSLDDPDNILAKTWSAVESAYGYIGVIGASFLLLSFFTEMIEKSTTDNFSTDHLVRMLLKLFAGIMLITIGPDVVKYLVQFGSALYSDVKAIVANAGGVAVTNVVLKNAYFKLKDSGIWSGIGYMLAILTPSLFVTLAKIGFTAIAMGRVIELTLRMLFAPIGMANLYSNGTNAPGIRYMKRLLAVSIQGVLIYAVIILYPILLGTGVNLIKSVAMSFIAVGAAAKSQSVANDIVGA